MLSTASVLTLWPPLGQSGFARVQAASQGLRLLSPLHRDHHGGRPYPSNRDVGGEGGRVRQRGAAHPHVAPARQCAGRGALGPLAAEGVLETLTTDEVWPAELLAKAPEY